MKTLRQLTPLLLGFRQDDISSLESRLKASLDPVTPSPEFVNKLREQLLSQWGAFPHLPNNSTPLIILGVLSGFVFILVLIRALLVLLGLLTVSREYRRKSNREKQSSVNIIA